MSLEFVRHTDGRCELLEDGVRVWSSDDDDDYLEEFDALIDPEEIDNVLAWLEDAGYIEDGEPVDIADHSDDWPDDDEDEDEDDWPDDDDEDEDDTPWLH